MSIMSYMMAALYDRTMANSEAACLGEWRQQLLQNLSGRVLDFGSGTGVNLQYYANDLQELLLFEPDLHMQKMLQTKLTETQKKATLLPPESSIKEIPAASIDVVVSTLVLCTVPDQLASLAEIKTVLKPGGKLVFLEHVADEKGKIDPLIQKAMGPIWNVVACGCQLRRHTEKNIQESGFKLDEINYGQMLKVPRWVRPIIYGVAERI
jgi:SAM-dependent methyltransferase